MSVPQLIFDGISLLGGQMTNEQKENSILNNNILEFFRSQGINTTSSTKLPPVDIIDNGKIITIIMDIPGVDDKSIDVDFFNNKVVIKGKRECTYKQNENVICKNEITYGKFEKIVLLPVSITNEKSVTINSKNGILIIEINKIIEEEHKFSLRIS